jgi:hypothetical protein
MKSGLSKIAATLVTGMLLAIGLCRVSQAADDFDIKLNSTDGSTQMGVQNANGANVVNINSLGTVNISSNTIMPGTTVYQSGWLYTSSTTVNGFLQMYSTSVAEFRTITPTVAGQVYYCNNCTTVPICISTGTTRGAFALITSKITACS